MRKVHLHSILGAGYMSPVCQDETLAGLETKGPHRPDAIWQREANLGFLLSFKFRPFQFFSNFQKHFSNLR